MTDERVGAGKPAATRSWTPRRGCSHRRGTTPPASPSWATRSASAGARSTTWVFLHEFRSLHDEAADEFGKNRRTFERAIERILVEGVDAGEFVIANTRLAALGWLGLHNYMYIWHHPGGPFTVDLIADNFADIYLRGVQKR